MLRLCPLTRHFPQGVPQKGALLTLLTVHWFKLFESKLPSLKTHLLSTEIPSSLGLPAELSSQLQNRSMAVRRLKIFPLESIVRGYITGSAWSEYKKTGTVHGIVMPAGLQESAKLEKPLWTPSTKAEVGDKDENISPEKARGIVGEKYAAKIEELSLQIYSIVRGCFFVSFFFFPPFLALARRAFLVACILGC